MTVPPQLRVVSLLSSATELLCALDCGEAMLVGRSHRCDWPPGIRGRVPNLTDAANPFESSLQMHEAVNTTLSSGKGLYAIDSELLQSLKPDVVLTQSLCSVCSVDVSTTERALRGLQPAPILVDLNPSCLEDVIADVRRIGRAVGQATQGEAAAARLEQRVQGALELAERLGPCKYGKVAFLEWTEPLFPGGHWTPQLIRMAGASHPINPPRGEGGALPSVAIEPQAVVECDPDLIIICPCGLDLEVSRREAEHMARQAWWSGLRAVREGHVLLVDGNQMFNRSGPRLVDALEWLVAVLRDRHDLAPPGFPYAVFTPPEEQACEEPKAQPGKEAGAAAQAVNGHAHANGCCAPAMAEAAVAASPWLPQRVSAAPGMPADIEEAHEAACAQRKGTYPDPSTGYTVFTEQAMLDRGSCCGNKCRHCPWGHFSVKSKPRTNRVAAPALLDPRASATLRSTAAASGSRGAAGASTGKAANGSTNGATVLVAWDGSTASSKQAQAQLAEGKAVVLLAALDARTQRLWGEAGAHVHAAMDEGVRLGVPLAVVPLQVEGAWLQQRELVASALAHVVTTACRLMQQPATIAAAGLTGCAPALAEGAPLDVAWSDVLA